MEALLRIVRLRRRARIVDGCDIVSEVLDHPGPTDTMFDVLAACIAALTPGPRVLVLGFAGGGLVAPLRAMGFTTPLTAVDRSRRGERLFRELCGAWAGDVEIVQDDAAAWLQRSRARYDLILEDLSVPSTPESVKPVISLDTLPELMRARLRPRGIAVTNVLPVPGSAWNPLLAHLAEPFARGLVVHLDDYVNRLLLAGPLASAATVSRALRCALGSIGSTQARRLSVRELAARDSRERHVATPGNRTTRATARSPRTSRTSRHGTPSAARARALARSTRSRG